MTADVPDTHIMVELLRRKGAVQLRLRRSVSGWLLTPFLATANGKTLARLRSRIAEELTTILASGYSHEISLEQALAPATITAYVAKRTGEKYLITL